MTTDIDTPILITGASGTVGRVLAERLAAQGVPLRLALRNPQEAAGLPERMQRVRFDFTDPATHAAAFDGVRRLFLLRPPQIANVRRDMGPALEQAARSGVDHVVFLSLLGADRNPLLPHAALEKLLLAGPMATTFLRCGFFMQNLSTTHRLEIAAEDRLFIPAGRGRTSFIDARDIGAIAARILTEPGHGGRAYGLTGAEALDYGAVARELSGVLARPIQYQSPALLRFVWYHVRRGLPLPFALVMGAIYTTTRLGLAATVTPDAADLLGRQPTTLAQFIDDYRAVWAPEARGPVH